MKVVAVIPAYNEASRIALVIPRVRSRADEVIVVDDGSLDDTFSVAQASGVRVLRHAINRGQGAALKTGTLCALSIGADVIVHVDADGQHDPDGLLDLIAPITRGEADVVYGSRFMGVESEGMPLMRRCLLMAGRVFSTFALGIPRRFTDPQSGLRAMNAQAARSIQFHQDRKAHCSELLRAASRSSLRVIEIPARVTYTSETLAKGNKTMDALDIAWQLLLGAFQK
ncbi:hypothetical protein A2856_01410 [Candidatus Uhrbacteria bacterium RIFCSPHIGHO2_01_FULL_63_20]|uniref:Glycosyltransferase 2-like domain-containing protein n=1 Tax=Candidatus Uhrbacteria bacterium RIFCSPHIGHO2_01_FULL_63_20 TaxID=1802385 RepID=A0A1F7TL98_9BACT|nr:MAG: hypothetical protein A2856_01410 [Candidatus Uhrbacteria bacterium RIFCSPHIGHO2_01_FULL_63_20]